MKKRELKLVNHELGLLLLEANCKLADNEYEHAQLENRVKMLRAGLEDGQRERKQLRVEIEQLKKNREYLKWLLFDRGDDVRPETPRPQPAPLRKPRRLWRSILCKRECE